VSKTSDAAQAKCPQLEANVPADLVDRRIHTASPGFGTPLAVGVIWSKKASVRIVHLGAAPNDDDLGDGTPITPVPRTVQGARANEIIDGDTHQIVWTSATATTCPHWSVTSAGLSAAELNAVLGSMHEPGAPTPKASPSCSFPSSKPSRSGSGFVVELNVMSGNPNPAWRLSTAEGAQLRRLLAKSRKGVDADAPDELGGFAVIADRRADDFLRGHDLPSRFWVQRSGPVADFLNQSIPCDPS
jgi:hypothetical protein